jgi:hypothetical protein
MKIAAHCWQRFAALSIVAISLAFRYAPASAAESEVAYLSLKAETLVPIGRGQIWKMSCRGKLTTSEEDLLSDLVGSALPGDGLAFNEYKVRIGLLLGQERYYFDNELRLSGPRPGVRILSESARSRFLATLGQVLATNAACDLSTDPRRSVGRDAVPFECHSARADTTARIQTAEEAIARAKGAWAASGRPEMSTQELPKYEPYQAVLVNGAWHVYGSLKGRPGEEAIGGTPEASICDEDGRIRIWHGQ